ncbi:MAG: ABC transporter ATP-binding protein [Treponema sp.]|jgi:oligopeptide/dipeptide ABC transporter ATP-binding protein|nr:ABC transporter ATP-binding protein [Treponema sp.]
MGDYFTIKDLTVEFKGFGADKQVLAIDSLTIRRGETYGLVGESGAGKTVLAQTILRLLPCPPCIIGGGMCFDGIEMLDRSEREMRAKIRGRRISMIFQDPMSTLNPVFTVGRQLLDVIAGRDRINRKAAALRAVEMLEKVRMPDAERLMEKYPHELSGGQRQRVIIAMALSCGAEFLIADEPTRNLDVTIQAGILQIIAELRRDLGITVLFIANNMGLVSVFCDEVAVLREGNIVDRGTPRNIISSPGTEYTKTMLRSLPDRTSPRLAAKPAELLRVTDLKKYFPLRTGPFGGELKHVRAVDGVSFAMNTGDTLGIVGESGCGKTTLINLLLGLDKPSSGRVEFEGRDLVSLPTAQFRAMRRHIQVVFQDPFWSLDPRMLIRDVVGEPLRVHEKLSSPEYNRRIGELLELAGLPPEAAYRFPHELSGGQRQRIAIARALALDARFVVLDEPTSSIDVVSQTQILRLLEDLKDRYGLTYVIISHDLSVVHFMSTHIMVMYLGKIMEYGPAELIFENPRHPYTLALLGSIPRLDMDGLGELKVIEGQVPSAIDIPPGCRFHPRCPNARESCRLGESTLSPLEDGRLVACNFV